MTHNALIGVIWAGIALSSCALAFRYFVRIKYFGRLHLDDFFTGFAFALSLATAIMWTITLADVYYMKTAFSNKTTTDDRPRLLASVQSYLYSTLSMLLMFYIGLWSIKIGFLVFFRKLGYQITYYRIYWWVVTILTVLAGVACIGDIQYSCSAPTVQEVLKECTRSSPRWRERVTYATNTLVVNCVLDVLTDLLIMSLPISILWNVRISLTRKLRLAGLFSLVVITIVVSIVRVAFGLTTNNEGIWHMLWHFIEFAAALLVACLGLFRTLFTAKTRREDCARFRDEEAQRKCASDSRKKRILRRARQLQDSLFGTAQDDAATTTVNSAQQGNEGGECERTV